jgi:hypothetical protein
MGKTHFMQSLAGVVSEQSKHGAHEKIEYGLRNAQASVYAHLCNFFSTRITKAVAGYIHKTLAVYAIG